MAGSILLPWLLHAVGVVWWSRLLDVPAWAIFLAGCILLTIAYLRLVIGGPSRTRGTAHSRLRLWKSWFYLRAVMVGLALGVPLSLCAARWFNPPLSTPASNLSDLCARDFAADFDWSSGHGFAAFKVRNDQLAGGFLWEYMVAFQVKPRLDSFLRLANKPRIKGWGEVRVLKIIPLAWPGCWGCGGMGFAALLGWPRLVWFSSAAFPNRGTPVNPQAGLTMAGIRP
ncbi:MAG: hypothetical protein LAN62_02440 [Acidobacteriia bacterium]|nr:hypothetical protein [Terriglobia bacterium]